MPDDEDARFIVRKYPQPPAGAGRTSPTARKLLEYLTFGGTFGRIRTGDLFTTQTTLPDEAEQPEGDDNERA